MKLWKRLTALLLCLFMLNACLRGSLVPTSASASENTETGDTQSTETTAPTEDQNVPVALETPKLTLIEQLLAAQTTDALYALVAENEAQLNTLTAMDLLSLYDLAQTLDPNSTNANTAKIRTLLDENGGVAPATPQPRATVVTFTASQSVSGQTINTNTEWVLQNNVTITIAGNITLGNSATLTIRGYGKILRKTGTDAFFNISQGCGIVTSGNSVQQPIILDGNNELSDFPMIRCHGTAKLSYTVIQNSTTNTNARQGGAILIPTADPLGSLTMNYCTIQNNSTISLGGGIYSCAPVSISNSSIINNHASRASGGGIVLRDAGAKLTMTNSKVSDNTSAGSGGGIWFDQTTLASTLNGCTISGNTAAIHGGGIYCVSPLTVTNSTISNNTAKNPDSSNTDGCNGGGLCVLGSNASLTLTGSTVSGNKTDTYGGGIYCNAPLNISTSEISGNFAMTNRLGSNNGTMGRGGGITLDGSRAIGTLAGTNVTGNTARCYGGGVDVRGHAKLTMASGTVSGNTTLEASGGGVHVTGESTFILQGGTISGNTGYTNGGGIYSSNGCTLTLTGGEITGNTVYGRGGGLSISTGGAITLSNTKIDGNFARSGNMPKVTIDDATNTIRTEHTGSFYHGRGGGLVVDCGTATMTGGSINDNYAEAKGGGICLLMEMDSNSTDAVNLKVVAFNLQGGTVQGNKTDGNGGGIYLAKNNKDKLSGTPTLTATNGTVSGNEAVGNGGAAYLEEATAFILDGAEFTNNSAANGGVVYIASGTATVNSGTLAGNNASADGGAIYIASGSATINDGTVSGNEAGGNGGALYVNGTVTMNHGTVSGNTATNGGAVYVTSGDFTMYSGKLIENHAVEKTAGQAEAGNQGYGGSVYANGGNIFIGVLNCTRATPCSAHASGQTTHHPIISDNTAVFGGGLAINNGTVTLYCCDVLDNQSDNAGTGMNVFMSGDSGTIYHHLDGAEIGEETDHGIVSINGTLNVVQAETVSQITITYHSNNENIVENNVQVSWTGSAPKGYYLNLPYCPSLWSDIAETQNQVFAGWSESNKTDNIRDKSHYMAISTPVEITDKNGGDSMNFYAIWVKKTHEITYRYSLDGTTIVETGDGKTDFTGQPTSYPFQMTTTTVSLPNPTRAGYTFVGWRMYAKSTTFSNWGMDAAAYEPVSIDQLPANNANYLQDSTLTTQQNFGDIVMVAVFKPALVDLTITTTGSEDSDNQVFIFTIVGNPDDENLTNISMQIMVEGDRTVRIEKLPIGSYTITELTGWSWRYAVEFKERNRVLNDPEQVLDFTYTQIDRNPYWLSGDSFVKVQPGRGLENA